MAKLSVPSDPDGFRELLNDANRVKAYFSAEAVADGSNRAFLNAYAKEFVKRNGDTDTDIRDQVKAVMQDLLRDNGADGKTAVNLANSISFENGRPAMRLSADGSGAIARGRGAVYNKNTAGARMEREIPEADRFHSLGEYCQAIRFKMSGLNGRNRDEMVRKLDRVTSFMNSFSSEDPGAGGFLIPELMRSELFMLALENSLVRSRATVIPMSTLSVPIPVVDDTSHVSNVFGGISFAWTEEAAQIAESAATFGRVTLVAKKLAGTFITPNELLNDAPAFAAFIDQRLPQALAWTEDLAFMTESGAGTPLGFVNAPAAVQVAKESGQPAGTVVWENIVKMYASMWPNSHGNAVWVCSHDVFPQLMTMALSVGTGGSGVMVGNFPGMSGSDAPPMTILGRPVYFTEKIGPVGTVGDINYVDLSYYAIGDRQAVEVAASEHFKFQNDQTTFRIIERVDGRPLIQSAVTPHNNSSITLSPFVQLAAR